MAQPLIPRILGSIDTPANLALVDLTFLPTGQHIAAKTAYQGLWFLRNDSTATPDGVTVVDALGQAGNWHRDPSGTPGAHLVTAWYVDTSLGSDSAAGTSALTPLATTAEIFRRIGQQAITSQTVVIDGAGAVTVLSVAPSGGTTNAATLAALLASTSASAGASQIGLRDVATIYTATNVEAALAEVKVLVDAGMQVQKKTVTATHATLVAAAATETVNIGTALPANSRIVGVDFHTMTAFSGGTISDFTVDIGTSGDVDALIDGADLFAAAVDGGPATIPQGIRPNKFLAAGGQLIATFRCGSDDVADASAGAITIDVLYVVLA